VKEGFGYMPNKNRVRVRISNTSEDILHFSLQGLLASGYTLALNTTLGTLSLLKIEDHLPHVVREQQFSANEMAVLLPLLEAYPYHCPHEVLYASLTYHNVTDERVSQCRNLLHDADAAGILSDQMKPVRNILSRTRLKLEELGIGIASIMDTGYILMEPKKQR
jgi:hypothetical protein